MTYHLLNGQAAGAAKDRVSCDSGNDAGRHGRSGEELGTTSRHAVLEALDNGLVEIALYIHVGTPAKSRA